MPWRKQCQCGCEQWFVADHRERKFLSRAHFNASPQYRAQVAAAGPLAAAARVRNWAARPMVLKEFGTLTERERAIYTHARRNGLVHGRRKGYEAGIRRGYALALGEHDEATWPSDAKRRTAA